MGRQGKHTWLLVRQLIITAGWWDAPLALWDLAKAISITKFIIWNHNIGKRGLFEKGRTNTLCELWVMIYCYHQSTKFQSLLILVFQYKVFIWCNQPIIKCLVWAIIGINFQNFSNCPLFTWAISNFSKMHLGNFPNHPSKHVIYSTNWLG